MLTYKELERINRRRRILGYALGFLTASALWIGGLVVLIHFISKYW